jgi:hypothetical protein
MMIVAKLRSLKMNIIAEKLLENKNELKKLLQK